jgi:hypothetical protein
MFAALTAPSPASTNQPATSGQPALAAMPPFPVTVFPPNPEWQTERDATQEATLFIAQHPQHPVNTDAESSMTLSVTDPASWPSGLKVQKVRRAIVSPTGWQFTANWHGVWLKDVLAKGLNIAPKALQHQYLLQRNAQGHHQTLRLTPDLLEGAFVATGLDGEPIADLWGGPVWLVLFNRYHVFGLEQLVSLELSAVPSRLPSRSDVYGLDESGTIAEGKYLECSNGQWTTYRAQ